MLSISEEKLALFRLQNDYYKKSNCDNFRYHYHLKKLLDNTFCVTVANDFKWKARKQLLLLLQNILAPNPATCSHSFTVALNNLIQC